MLDGTTHWALPVHSTFSDLDHISRSQQCQTILTENLMYWSYQVETLCDSSLHQHDHEHTIIWHLQVFKGDNSHVFWSEKKKKLCWLLLRHSLNKPSQTLHTRFDEWTLFQGHRCVRKVNCLLCFFNLHEKCDCPGWQKL